MKPLTNLYEQLALKWTPVHSLVIYACDDDQSPHYIESAQVDTSGQLINFHPLSVQEATSIGRTMLSASGKMDFLVPKGFIPANVLHINQFGQGQVIWHTPPQRRHLMFSDQLGIKDGRANLPGLVWKVTGDQLRIYALCSSDAVTPTTPLYTAPFHNVGMGVAGSVCMGNVEIEARLCNGLEAFIQYWETIFFNSHFTADHSGTVKGKSLATIYKEIVGTDNRFPEEELKKLHLKIKDIL